MILASGGSQGIYLLSKTTDSLRFAWDPIPNANFYTTNAVPWATNEVTRRLVKTDSLRNINELNTIENTVELTGLYPGLAYNVTITAIAESSQFQLFAVAFTGDILLSCKQYSLLKFAIWIS